MDSKFRMCGKRVEIYRYRITYNNSETEQIQEYAISEQHRDELLELHSGAAVETLDVSALEWLDGLEFGSYEEALQTLERGYVIEKPMLEKLQSNMYYLALLEGVEIK